MALRSNASDLRSMVASETSGRTTPAPVETPATPGVISDRTPSPQPATTATPATPEAPRVAPLQVSTDPRATSSQPPVSAPAVSTPTPAAAESVPAATAPAPPPAPTQVPQAPAPAPVAAPAPPTKYDEVTVLADSVLGLRLDSTISSETARVEDRVNARLSRDVLVDGRVAFASGSRLEGVVTQVERGGKFKDRPRLGVAFSTLIMADGTRVAIQTDTIFRDGDAPSGQANAKVGGSAVVGAILGAMIGGKKGALLGSAAGAAGGAAAVAAGDRAEAVMTSGSSLTVRLIAPVTVLIEREYDSQGRHR